MGTGPDFVHRPIHYAHIQGAGFPRNPLTCDGFVLRTGAILSGRIDQRFAAAIALSIRCVASLWLRLCCPGNVSALADRSVPKPHGNQVAGDSRWVSAVPRLAWLAVAGWSALSTWPKWNRIFFRRSGRVAVALPALGSPRGGTPGNGRKRKSAASEARIAREPVDTGVLSRRPRPLAKPSENPASTEKER